MATLDIRNPVAKSTDAKFPPAPRLTDLSNKTIGIYWNTKAGGDIALQRVAEMLRKDYPLVRLKHFTHHYPAPSDMIEDMASSCDAVIGSTGD